MRENKEELHFQFYNFTKKRKKKRREVHYHFIFINLEIFRHQNEHTLIHRGRLQLIKHM
jgi:hypothetical protein